MSDTRDIVERLRTEVMWHERRGNETIAADCREAAAEITRLRAALAAQVPQWLPIESAPRDGTLFLCWVSAVRSGETDEGQPYQQVASQVDFCSWRDVPSDLPGHDACGNGERK